MRTLAVLAVLQHVRQRLRELPPRQADLPGVRGVPDRIQQRARDGRPHDLLLGDAQVRPEDDLRDAAAPTPSSHPDASKLFENSGIFVFLAQQAQNQDTLARMFKLSDSQHDRLSAGAPKGTGLVVVDGLKIAMNNPDRPEEPAPTRFGTRPRTSTPRLKAARAV